MKIEMTSTEYCDGVLIWSKGDIYDIADTDESYRRIKQIDGLWYSIDKNEYKGYKVVE